MLFHVRMDVRLPADMPADVANEIKAREKAYSQDLQRSGKWRHIWRLVSEYANVSVFDGSVHWAGSGQHADHHLTWPLPCARVRTCVDQNHPYPISLRQFLKMRLWHTILGRCPQRTATKQIWGFVHLMYALTRTSRLPPYSTSGFYQEEAKPRRWQKSALFSKTNCT